MQTTGILIGIVTLALIGFGHWWVKWLLRRFGAGTWMPIAIVGLVLVSTSLFVQEIIISAMLGVAGFTTLWGAYEIIQHQHEFTVQTQ